MESVFACPTCGRLLEGVFEGMAGRIVDGRKVVFGLYCRRCKCVRAYRVADNDNWMIDSIVRGMINEKNE